MLLLLFVEMALVCLAHKFLLFHYYIWIFLGYIVFCGAWSVDATSNACNKTVPECYLSLNYVVFNVRQLIINPVMIYN